MFQTNAGFYFYYYYHYFILSIFSLSLSLFTREKKISTILEQEI